MIPDSIVEEVRARADIVETIGEHVPLKRAGKDYRALCPFHQEKTPSFYVVPAKGFYKCFGCDEAGDVFSFLMKHLGLGFQEAVRALAQRVGVDVPDDAAEREADVHAPIRTALAFAADWYRVRLWEGRDGERARRYLERRGIDREAAERFQLGYAPDDWRGLRSAAATHGIDDDVLLEAGLTKTSERTDEPYDRLRDRLVFPIADAGGRIIAFGGRTLSRARDGVPKYLNSPETPVYHKGRTLYGLNWAKTAIRREGAALVVEGYMDYVSLAARGIENVVAGLGTAMTEEQATLLGRYSRQALLLYDSDGAGLRATFRTADALLGAGVHPLVVTLPPGEDPDSVVRQGGAEALRPYLDAAVDVLDRKLRILEERGYFETAEGTRKALDGLLSTLRAAVDPALRDIYVARVAERTGVRRETIEAELRTEATPARPPAARAPREAGSGRGPAPSPPRIEGVVGQRQLLLLMVRDASRIPAAAEALAPEEFTDPVYRELFEALVQAGGLEASGPAALEVSDAARERLETLLGDREELSDAEQMLADLINDIRSESVHRRLDALEVELAGAQRRGDEEAATALMRQKMELMHQLRAMGYPLERMVRRRTRTGQSPSTKEG